MQRGGGLLERDEINAGREKGKRRGGCMLPPHLSPNGGGSSYEGGSQLLFSLRIKAPFTGCYLLRTGILCWDS